MDRWGRLLIATAGLLGASGVGLGAAGAHLEGGDLARLASDFLLFHAAAIPGMLALPWRSSTLGKAAASLMALGSVCFSGALAGLAFHGSLPVPGLAPFGGLALIAGWLVLAWAAFSCLSRA